MSADDNRREAPPASERHVQPDPPWASSGAEASPIGRDTDDGPRDATGGGTGPSGAPEVVARLEAKISLVHPVSEDDGPFGEDFVREVPGSGEPPD